MKYHTTISTIIISVAVAFMFAFMGFFIITNLNMTSPTLIAANRILSDFESSDSRISISFDSLDRNFRDGIFINGFRLYYDQREIFSADKISVNKGLFASIRYVISRKGTPQITIDKASVTVPDECFASDGSSQNKKIDLALPEALERWGFIVNIRSADIKAGGISIDNASLRGSWNYGLSGSELEFRVPHFEYEGLSSDRIVLRADADGIISIALSASAVACEYSGLELGLSGLQLKAATENIESINLEGLSISAGIGKSTVSYNGSVLDFAALSLAYGNNDLSLIVKSIDSMVSGFKVSAESLDLESKISGPFAIALSGISAYYNDSALCSVPEASLSIDAERKSATALIPDASSSYTSGLIGGFIEDASLKDLSLSVLFSDGIKGSVDSGISISLNDKTLESMSLNASSSFDFTSGGGEYSLSSVYVSLDKITAGGFSGTGRAAAEIRSSGIDSEFSFGSSINGTLSYDGVLRGRVSVKDYFLSVLSPFIEEYVPALSSYISSETSLDGDVSFALKPDEKSYSGFSGPIDTDLGLSDIRFNQYSFDLRSSLSAAADEKGLSVSRCSLITDWVTASFSGGFDFASMLPFGDFGMYYTSSGKKIVSLSLGITGERVYLFRLSSPYLDSVDMAGTLDFSRRNLISSYAELTTPSSLYPFGIDIDFENKNVSLDNPQMHLYSSWNDKLIFESDFDDFPVIAGNGEYLPCYIDGDLSFAFDFAEQSFALDSPSLKIKNIRYLSGNPDLSFSLKGDNSSVAVNDILIRSSMFPDLFGRFLFDMENFGLLLNLSDEDENPEQVLMSIIKDDSAFSGILNGRNLRLERFGQPGMAGFLSLSGSGNNFNDFAFTGNFSARSIDEVNDQRNVSSSIFLNSSSLVLSDLKYSTGILDIGIDQVRADSEAGAFNADNISVLVTLEHLDRPYTASAAASVSASLPKGSTLYDTARELIKSRGEGIGFNGSISYVNYDNSLIAPERGFSGEYSSGKIMVYGSAVSGTADLENGTVSLGFDLMPITKFTLRADMNGKHGTDYYINFDSFAASVADLSVNSPILKFYEPSSLYGNLDLIATEQGYRMYGKLDSDYSEFDLFWLPGERIILHNPSFLIWDNVITSNLTDFTCMNLETNKRIPGRVRLELNFGPSMAFESYEVDVYLDEGNEVSYRLPMPESNMDIIGKVSGHFHIDNTTGVVASSGELRVSDTVLSVGMRELPSWFKSSSVETSSDFDITLASDCRVIFPLSSSPILTAFAENDTKLFFHNGRDGIRMRGDFSIRSGELYYFQKYFYITEGLIRFEENQKTLNPLINLRARLRDFDADGKQVDIYLNLKDSKLDDMNPTFESSPAKNLNEIMQILGQAILPASAYGKSSLTSVASLLTASVDVLSRVGLIKGSGTGLDQSIKNSLGLDIFSLHSNIVSNILTDTINLSGLGSDISSYSPMARYLSGTSVYIGKYLLPEVYLQALFHLVADSDPGENKRTFLSDDLILDSEFSVEWENPLCTMTFFTKPRNLTFYSILDGFGFTVSKRIIF